MDYVITLVASALPLPDEPVKGVMEKLGLKDVSPVWLDKQKALDLPCPVIPDLAKIKELRAFLAPYKIDVFAQPVENRRKKLLMADMDSTIITTETLDEIAALAGIAEKIAPITERAMRGEIGFIPALEERVTMLAGIERTVLQNVLESSVLSHGAETFTSVMRAHGATCVLVSGGFTFFTEEIGKKAGFDATHGNVLGWDGEKLNGKVLGDILDKDAKLTYLRSYRDKLKITPEETMAIGDGSNDLAMLTGAGLGIGYYPKPLVLESVPNCILHGDLTAALYAQGYAGF